MLRESYMSKRQCVGERCFGRVDLKEFGKENIQEIVLVKFWDCNRWYLRNIKVFYKFCYIYIR